MQKAKLYFSLVTIVTIDERMVSYIGRSNDIVYEASKPVNGDSDLMFCQL